MSESQNRRLPAGTGRNKGPGFPLAIIDLELPMSTSARSRAPARRAFVDALEFLFAGLPPADGASPAVTHALDPSRAKITRATEPRSAYSIHLAALGACSVQTCTWSGG